MGAQSVSEGPSLEEFRRWLQEELVMADSIKNKAQRENRRWQLESALQEALSFHANVARRQEAELPLYEEAAAVRLLATEEDVSTESLATNEGECAKCEEPMDTELEFCPVCGHFK
jgi:hypothetical protein